MSASAHAQLRDLVARSSAPLWEPPDGEAFDERAARPAAVLILFGVLDDHPAERPAHHAAVSRDLDVLLLTRAATLRSHPGQVAFPGGRVDDGDSGPVDAALREAEEETGLNPAGVEVLGPLADLALPFSRHRVTPVIGWWADPSPVYAVDRAESENVFRAPVADLLDPAHRYSWTMAGAGATHTGPAWRLDVDGSPRLVWGFTAGILDRLFAALDWEEPWDPSRRISLP
ncbi:CoA pyrophosphatase [Microbacterium sp. CBS5P-1]|nr:CoA pyrophosphatase [Microbacterium excoecariae]